MAASLTSPRWSARAGDGVSFARAATACGHSCASAAPSAATPIRASWAITPATTGAYRLNVCESCRRYIKTIDLREAAGERLLEAERVLTVGMDLAAHEAGYRRE